MRLRRVLEACPIPVSMCRFDGTVLYESPAMLALFGPSQSSVENLVEPGDREIFMAELRAHGGVDNWEQEYHGSDGRHFWGSISSRVIEFEGESVIVSSVADITQTRSAEAALRESEQLVRRVLEACPTPIQMTRMNGEIVYQSPSNLELFRESRYSTVARMQARHVDPTTRDAYLDVLREHGGVDDYEVEYRRNDGSSFPCSVSSRLVDFKDEQVIVSTFFDLTEERAREEDFVRQREALHQSEKLSALGELLAGVAHELNNPLSVVVGQAELLKENTADHATIERARKIGDAADRCARIVKKFLAMARQQPNESASIDMNELIESSFDVIGASLRSSNIRVELRLDSSLPAVRGDADQLTQVLTNLIINAKHALEEIDGERALTLSSSYKPSTGEVLVGISDNGPGVPQEIRSRIFEPFFTTKAHGAGTGIGLAFCHRVVAAHEGAIELDPDVDDGASFVIRLPGLPVDRDQGESRAQPPQSTGPLSVLVVEDEPDVANMTGEILRAEGHWVVIAHSAKVALKRLEKQNFDVILSDVRMPDLDGMSFYRILGERSPAALRGLAFVTGDALSPQVRHFLETAGRPHIEKPIQADEVRALVARIGALNETPRSRYAA